MDVPDVSAASDDSTEPKEQHEHEVMFWKVWPFQNTEKGLRESYNQKEYCLSPSLWWKRTTSHDCRMCKGHGMSSDRSTANISKDTFCWGCSWPLPCVTSLLIQRTKYTVVFFCLLWQLRCFWTECLHLTLSKCGCETLQCGAVG